MLAAGGIGTGRQMAAAMARGAAQHWGRKELVASSVGQIVSRMDRVRSSREVVLDMVTEYLEVVERLGTEELGAE